MVNTKDDINTILSEPQKMVVNDLELLKNTINEYPWFQAARSVYLKGLHNESSPLYNKELQVTASHTTDRGVLFDFITSPVFKQNSISNQIKRQQEYLNEIPVESQTLEVITEDLNSDVNFNNTLDNDLFERSESNIKDQPLNFTKGETHSFSQWLKLTTLKPIEREENHKTVGVKKEKEKDDKTQIIEKFLATSPKIKPSKDKQTTTNLADLNKPVNQLMTETLAQVYLAQNNYAKAIQAYEILILQHPEKSGFFADRIREIKNLSNS